METIYNNFDDALRQLISPDNRNPVVWYSKNNVVEWSHFIKRDDGLYEACGVLVRNCGDYVRKIIISGEFQMYLNSNIVSSDSVRDMYEYYPYIICVKTTEQIFPDTCAQFGVSKNNPVPCPDVINTYDFWLEDGRFAIVNREKMIILATFIGGINILNLVRPKYFENITISNTNNETHLTVNDMCVAQFKNGEFDYELQLDINLPIGKLVYSTISINPVPKCNSEIKVVVCFESCFDGTPETLLIDGHVVKIQNGCLGVLY